MEPADSLAAFVEAAGSGGHFRVEADLGDGFYRLRVEEAERRQAAQDIRSVEDAIIEMLRNARDAHARSVFLAFSRDGDIRRIVVVDDGDGIPPSMHRLIFEPRVTSKLDSMNFDVWGVHGRGMALYSISQNAKTARVAASDRGIGASLVVESDARSLKEKTDQSTFPALFAAESGTVVLRGPKNILRTACEFALEQRKSMSVYVGSQSEICATMYAYGAASLPAHVRAFPSAEHVVALCKRLSLASDDVDFAERANALGFDISARTSRRILDGDIRPVDSLLERMERNGIRRLSDHGTEPSARPSGPRTPRSSAQAAADTRIPCSRIRFDEEDLLAFASRVSCAFGDLAEPYYLDPDIEPSIRQRNGQLTISIPLVAARES